MKVEIFTEQCVDSAKNSISWLAAKELLNPTRHITSNTIYSRGSNQLGIIQQLNKTKGISLGMSLFKFAQFENAYNDVKEALSAESENYGESLTMAVESIIDPPVIVNKVDEITTTVSEKTGFEFNAAYKLVNENLQNRLAPSQKIDNRF